MQKRYSDMERQQIDLLVKCRLWPAQEQKAQGHVSREEEKNRCLRMLLTWKTKKLSQGNETTTFNISTGQKQLIFNLSKQKRQWKKPCSLVAQGRVLQESLFSCGSHSLAGILLLVLCWFGSSYSLFFPDHQVHRIRVPGPSSWEIEDTSLEATS